MAGIRTRGRILSLFWLWAIAVWFSNSVAVGQSDVRSKELYQRHAESHTGDASRGKQVFENRDKAGCNKCHTVDGNRTGVGPDLASIGFKYERGRLIESILEPSKMIADGYSTTILATDSGKVHTGILQRVTGTFIELKDAESKTTQIPLSEIEEQQQSNISIMPLNVHTLLTPEEFTDLITYLGSLRAASSAKINASGFVEETPFARRTPGLKPRFDLGLRFDHPVAIVPVPKEPERFVIVEQAGGCWIAETTSGKSPKPLLDISSQVRLGGATGLLGFLFHPRFPDDRRVFLKYQIADRGRIVTIVEERKWSSAETGQPVVDSPRELFRIVGSTQDHNGGSLAFGPDGMLYIGMGDSGPQRDPEGHAQDLKTLLGKLLRVDIDRRTGDLPYAIPADNPFVDHPTARKEIWALGFREPWRISFDSKTTDLWVGDVGQDRFEEVSIVRKGENCGWNVIEGFANFSDRFRSPESNFVAPIVSYPRQLGVSVTGGYVYRGKRAPQLEGWYVFGDFESRRIWALRQENRKLAQIVELGRAPSRIVSFAEQADGELVIVGFDDGIVRQLDLASADISPLRRHAIAETAEQVSVSWRYTRKTPGRDWEKVDFDGNDWNVGPAGFGTVGTPSSVVRTDWNTADIWLRREFTVRHQIAENSNIVLRLHHDEDVEVYINGVLAAQANRWTTGYIEVPINAAAKAAIREESNCLAVHCHQNGGGQYIDVGIVELRDE
jgi:putative heme-binding domain-containing protein